LYRINTVEIVLPPLRERREDIPLLLEHYARLYAQKYNMPPRRFSSPLLDRLRGYSWPGNVRALRHAVERAMILGDGPLLHEADFPLADDRAVSQTSGEATRLDDVEKSAIDQALKRHGGNVSRAARDLGLTRASLYRRMDKYGL
ncbi:MAG: sigma-54-dependent Fis family transcriptional regulator, partial [Proteobacteria bacterium]|nr:sigma-54-dependent Fis family transcriptional regulator [Pseudomonadota bacterium]